mmetsp:Transcript_31105/g.62390  ORF Transcript_31105/g.62390 Transcript_31105/m.62390 type:complete len:247 (-) Transcript_31105:228-968(-)
MNTTLQKPAPTVVLGLLAALMMMITSHAPLVAHGFVTVRSSPFSSSSFKPLQSQLNHDSVNIDPSTSSSLPSFDTSSPSSSSSPRRDFLTKTIATTSLLLTTTASAPLPSRAKEPTEPLTRELVTSTFQSIRDELTSPTGVVPTLTSLLDGKSYAQILQYTKESDAYFRKGKLGKARKLLSQAGCSKEVKDAALGLSNAVTFDLIGINRASREGRVSEEDGRRYLGELRADVEKFLELEKEIVLEE